MIPSMSLISTLTPIGTALTFIVHRAVPQNHGANKWYLCAVSQYRWCRGQWFDCSANRLKWRRLSQTRQLDAVWRNPPAASWSQLPARKQIPLSYFFNVLLGIVAMGAAHPQSALARSVAAHDLRKMACRFWMSKVFVAALRKTKCDWAGVDWNYAAWDFWNGDLPCIKLHTAAWYTAWPIHVIRLYANSSVWWQSATHRL